MVRRVRYDVQSPAGAPMKIRAFLAALAILGTVLHSAAAQAKNKTTQVDAPPLERVLSGTSMQSSPVLPDVIARKPEMPLGPQDILISYEVARSLVVEKTSADFSVIVQTQQANQISRE